MKLLLLSLLFSLNLMGQTFLTKGEVFDREIGDKYQYYYHGFSFFNGSNLTYHYCTSEVLDKNFSAGMDTIFYSDKVTIYVPQQSPEPAVTTIDTIEWFVSGLSDSVFNYQPQIYDTCSLIEDSSGIGLCGIQTWNTYTISNSFCFEQASINYVFYKGIGGWFGSEGNGDIWFAKELIFYKKGQQECGIYITQVNEVSDIPTLKIFPNPSSGNLKIESKDQLSSFRLTSTKGQLVLSGVFQNNEISLENIEKGIYFLEIESESGGHFSQKIIRD